MSLEQNELSPGKKVYLVAFRTAARKALFVGQIAAEKSKTRRVEEKASKH